MIKFIRKAEYSYTSIEAKRVNNKERGNVLFLILIAVALFAALSYAVTQSTRGGGNADSESSLIDSASLTQFGSSVAVAVMRMQISGVDETNLCFYSGSNNATYNHASCADNNNNVFHSDGGGVSYQNPTNGFNDGTEWEFTSRVQVFGQGTTTPLSAGNHDNAEFLILLRGMNQNICLKINEEMGISGIPVDSGDVAVDRFDGNIVQGDSIDGCNPNCATVGASPIGQVAANVGCIEEEDTGDLIYFHTLLPVKNQSRMIKPSFTHTINNKKS
jgi:hypothetical protein